MNILKKMGNIILDILIAIIGICFIFALYHYASIKIMNKPYTNFFGYTYFNIKTGSMADTINQDDYILVKITKDVKENDIISYVTKDEVVTHRIIEIKDNEIITKGDANNTEDDPIQKTQIIGKVIKVGRGFGKVFKVITEPLVIIPFFGALILINLAFTNLKKQEKKEFEKNNEKKKSKIIEEEINKKEEDKEN